ncbi:MAG TPA: hypothetical protein PLV72_01135 [Candidatus Magasanikbacteria bacterium]|nr:hypothetical protein [Candidatus Magasanikbacteria bacterium]
MFDFLKKKPAANTPPKFDFLSAYVEKVLHDIGFIGLSEENKKMFLPQFVAQVQVRIGAAVMPLLDESAGSELDRLMNKEGVSEADWLKFWQTNVPNFQEVVDGVLGKFAGEMKMFADKI